MDFKNIAFNVGDRVITCCGEVGEITECFVDYGYYKYVIEDRDIVYFITDYDFGNRFENFYQIGNHFFNKFDKDRLIETISSLETELDISKRRLRSMEEIEKEIENAGL